jgi:dihydrofolate reductase
VEGFKHGGWSSDLDDEAGQFKFEEAMVSEAMLLGRKTYQAFAQAWPSQEGEFADKFNTMPKYVVSSTLRDPSGPTPPS